MSHKKHNKWSKEIVSKGREKADMGKVLRIIFGLVGLLIIVLGVHGLYVHFNKLSFLEDSAKSSDNPLQDTLTFVAGNYQALYDIKLFGVVPMPGFLGTITDKVSDWGLQSWFSPLLIGISGFLVFIYRGKIVGLLYRIFRL